MYVANQGILSLYSLGRLTCIILGSGDGVSYSQVVWEGIDEFFPLLSFILMCRSCHATFRQLSGSNWTRLNRLSE